MENGLLRAGYVLALCGLLGASGCAGNGTIITKDQIANTERSISEVRNSNATIKAPLELKMAEEKLEAAKAAMEKKEYEQARFLIEKAQVDSDLALAKTNSIKAKQNVKELRDSIDALDKEIERSQKAQ